MSLDPRMGAAAVPYGKKLGQMLADDEAGRYRWICATDNLCGDMINHKILWYSIFGRTLFNEAGIPRDFYT